MYWDNWQISGTKTKVEQNPSLQFSSSASMLVDSYSRSFRYLRLSITERCNFSCNYCLPFGYQKESAPPGPELSVEEIERLVKAFAQLGVSKIRITGGEPTVRRDVVEIIEKIRKVVGINEVAMTTNGSQLKRLAGPLLKAGLSAINISLDSLDPSRFEEITGSSQFENIYSSIDDCLSLGYKKVKVNAVLLKGQNDIELSQFLEWIKNRPISMRFIELMQTGVSAKYFQQNHMSAGVLQFELQKKGWKLKDRQLTDGPALVYCHPEYKGSIGVIAPYSQDFCKSCNRLRVSSRGGLQLCLFGETEYSLRKHIQCDSHQDSLIQEIKEIVMHRKLPSHFLNEGRFGKTQNFASIGG